MLREEVNILVVDDVNTMRVHIKDLLRECGFRKIQSAANGEEAKRLLDTEPFHLILADWHMQPTTGFDLLQHVRSSANHKDIAFVMVTAETTKECVISAVQSGVDNYVLKPITVVEIQNKVYGVLLKKKIL